MPFFTFFVWLTNYKRRKREICEDAKGMKLYLVRGKRKDFIENVKGALPGKKNWTLLMGVGVSLAKSWSLGEVSLRSFCFPAKWATYRLG